MAKNDQQCTPNLQNLQDFFRALFLRDRPRPDGRGWLDAITHEGKNVIVEFLRHITGKCPK